jgi:uracil-DNA glycosylase
MFILARIEGTLNPPRAGLLFTKGEPLNREIRLKELEERMRRARLPLKESAKCLVFGRGNPDARIMFIGQAPGRTEDRCGEPFAGSAGKLLDRLLAAGDLEREDIYITSILKYFPPRNRAPNLDEIKAHTPYLMEQIRIIEPQIVAPMGNFAARFVLAGFNTGYMDGIAAITAIHGKPRSVAFEGRAVTVFPLFHPAAALYFPPLKKKMLKDFRYFLTV